MKLTQTLSTSLSPASGTSSSTSNTYWLRMEQITGDDKASTAEVAKIVDEFYSIDPCVVPEDPEEPENPDYRNPDGATLDDLLILAKSRIDLAECERRKSGDYTARVKVIRSHLTPEKENVYTLKPSVGTVTKKVKTNETITLTLNIKEQDNVRLDYPILHKDGEDWPGTAKWLGSVWTEEDGAIPPPTITGSESDLSWEVNCTGTLLVEFPTTYDIVTVEIPGLPSINSGLGSVRDCTLRAFYRLQVYETTVTAANTDTTANDYSLSALCGWSSLTPSGYGPGSSGTGVSGGTEDGDGDGDGEGDDEEGDGPELGCIEEETTLSNREFYKKMCCAYPTFDLPDCATYATLKPAEGLTDEDKTAYRRNNDRDNISRIEFVAVGPGPEGCGRILTTQTVKQRNCCEDITDLEWNYDLSAYIVSPSSYVDVYVKNGARPLLWKLRGRGFWVNKEYTRREIATAENRLRIYADATACGFCTITVDDDCTMIQSQVRSTQGQWVQIDPRDCQQRLSAHWADNSVVQSGVGVYSWFWHEGGRYKVKQKYWTGFSASGGGVGMASTFDNACAQVDETSWKSLIADIESSGYLYTNFTTYPELINIDKAVHLVPWSQYFHGNETDPQYGNVIEYQERFFGVEYGKYMSGFNLDVETCVGAYTGSLSTGYVGIGSPNPDAAECYAWEWTC